ncbi:MAG: metallophosphoesterase [Bryobacteraceae bacterium]
MRKLLLVISLSLPLFSQGQPAAHPLSDAILNRVLPDYRDQARSLLTATEEQQASALRMSDDNLAAYIVTGLCRQPEAFGFLLAQLEKEASAKLRIAILQGLRTYWASHPEAQKIVENHVTSDADANVSVKALDLLRQIRMTEMNRLLQTRLATALKSGDSNATKQLGQAEEHWYGLMNETTLPAFLRTPPPLFSLKPPDKPIRVLAFGDFGTGSPAQVSTAKAMVEFHHSHPFDFGLTLGDNFYTYGMMSPADPRWQTQWEQLYGPMGIKFYATLGNHDWASPDSPAAEILYSEKSPDWRLPAPYYTFTAGAVQFFAFDTVECNEAELQWLDSELAKSTAPWKLVYGHYHIYSATRGDNKVLIERLLPVLKKNHVDIYLNGHDHNLQEEKPEDGVHFFVSGGGGAGLYEFNPYDRTIFKQKLNGFTVLEADQKHFKISFVGTDGKELYQRTLDK